MRDLQLTGAPHRKKVACFAARASVDEATRTVRTHPYPTVTTSSFDRGANPKHQSAGSFDPSVAVPSDDLGIGGLHGMTEARIGHSGTAMFQMHIHGINFRGTSGRGGLSRPSS